MGSSSRGSDGESSDRPTASAAIVVKAAAAAEAAEEESPPTPRIACGFASSCLNGPDHYGNLVCPLSMSHSQRQRRSPSVKTLLTSDIEAAEFLVQQLQDTIRALTQVCRGGKGRGWN